MTRIVLIEDEAPLRAVLRRYLEGLGYEVAEADDGARGLALIHAQPSDVVITDIFMEGGEGLAAINQIRRQYPALKIIAMSGGHERFDPLALAKELGADQLLAKPFDLSELRKALADVTGTEPSE